MPSVIQSSKDYNKFSFIGANRDTSRGHIENLKKAFEENGNLTEVQPILVNDRFEIIDGQHRFNVCKELGVEIYFTQVPGLTVHDARSLNILHRRWHLSDYIESYARAGDTNYQELLQLHEDYGFSLSVTVKYAVGNEPKGLLQGVRDGNFTLEDRKGAEDRLGKLADTGLFVPFVQNAAYAAAMLHVLNISGYDHKRMLRKLELGQHLLERKGSVDGYLRMLEEVYNHQMTEANRLRLW